MTIEMEMSTNCKVVLAEATRITRRLRYPRIYTTCIALAILDRRETDTYIFLAEMLEETDVWVVELITALEQAIPSPNYVRSSSSIRLSVQADAAIEYAQIVAILDNRTTFNEFDLLKGTLHERGTVAKVFRRHKVTLGGIEEKSRMNIPMPVLP